MALDTFRIIYRYNFKFDDLQYGSHVLMEFHGYPINHRGCSCPHAWRYGPERCSSIIHAIASYGASTIVHVCWFFSTCRLEHRLKCTNNASVLGNCHTNHTRKNMVRGTLQYQLIDINWLQPCKAQEKLSNVLAPLPTLPNRRVRATLPPSRALHGQEQRTWA